MVALQGMSCVTFHDLVTDTDNTDWLHLPPQVTAVVNELVPLVSTPFLSFASIEAKTPYTLALSRSSVFVQLPALTGCSALSEPLALPRCCAYTGAPVLVGYTALSGRQALSTDLQFDCLQFTRVQTTFNHHVRSHMIVTDSYYLYICHLIQPDIIKRAQITALKLRRHLMVRHEFLWKFKQLMSSMQYLLDGTSKYKQYIRCNFEYTCLSPIISCFGGGPVEPKKSAHEIRKKTWHYEDLISYDMNLPLSQDMRYRIAGYIHPEDCSLYSGILAVNIPV